MDANKEFIGREAELRNIRLEYSRKNNLKAILIFAAVTIAYCVCFVLTLVVQGPLNIIAAVMCAWTIAMLFVVGHDACHQSLTTSSGLNRCLGVICFLPSLHNYSLWDLGHNKTHHRHNNVAGVDYVWEPMTPDEFRMAGARARLLYRFWRSPLGIPFYYCFDIWFPKMFLVRKAVTGHHAKKYWVDGIAVYLFFALQSIAAVTIGTAFGHSAVIAWLMAVFLPFAVWNILMSSVIYLHHTHPEVPWYASVEEWREQNGKLTGTVHVRFPWLVSKLMLEIMEHNAHHYAPGVPLYNLSHMQSALEGEKIVRWDWSFREFFRVARNCKLYDYSRNCWVGFPR